MLDWLKTILGDAYTEDIGAKVSAEIGKSFVARADFNATKERDKQLETLQASTGDVAALKETITTLQTQNAKQAKQHAAAIKQLKLDSAIEAALVGAKAKNVKAVKALLELDKAELAEDGTVRGLAEQLKSLVESPDTGFLFDTDSKKPGSFKGLKPGEKSDKTPSGEKTPENMSYDELCAYLAENPDAQL